VRSEDVVPGYVDDLRPDASGSRFSFRHRGASAHDVVCPGELDAER
jgi:hypothetical protein